MAISSPLNPEVISPSRRINTLAAQSFISGGSPLGSSIVASAANKIVGFQRGAGAGVAPQVPDLQSIIQTLSSNILNNVENRVQTIDQNVTQVVQKLTKDLGDDYKQKVLNLDAITPNKILENFLSLYEKAIGYIQFFADKNNIKRLGDNLDDLTDVFKETFNVAKNIRKTIVRIVDQLSSLPQAGVGGGGGLNLDVDIPGGSLKKSGGTNFLRMMKKRPGLMMGGAALAGAGASNVISGMADVRGGIQAAPTGDISGGLSGPVLERFDAILDRFNSAINSLASIKKPEPSPDGKKTSTAPPPPPAAGDKEQPSPVGAVTSTGSEQQKTEALIAAEEGLRLKAYKDSHGIPTIGYGQTKLNDRAVRMGDVMTKEQAVGGFRENIEEHRKRAIRDIGKSSWDNIKDENSKAVLTSIAYNYGHIPDSVIPAAKSGDPKKIAAAVGALKSNPERRRREANFILTGKSSRLDKDFLAGGKLAAAGTTITPPEAVATAKPDQKPSPTVTAAATQQLAQQQLAKQVAQPPATQTRPQLNVVPMTMGQAPEQSMQGTPSMPGSTSAASGVPFLPSGNNDNFLTLYSKMVYNIVDG